LDNFNRPWEDISAWEERIFLGIGILKELNIVAVYMKEGDEGTWVTCLM
jgi:hypothetical protein